MRRIGRLWHLLRPHRGRWVAALLCMALSAGTTAAFAWLSGPLLGAVLSGVPGAGLGGAGLETPEAPPLALFAVGLAALGLIRAGAGWLQTVWVARVQQDAVRDLRTSVYGHLLGLTARSSEGIRPGDLSARISADVAQVETVLLILVAPVPRALLTIVVVAGVAATLQPALTLLAALAIPPALAFVVWAARKSRRAHRAAFDAQGELSARVAETVRTLLLMRAYDASGLAAERFGHAAEEARARALTARKVAAAVGPAISFAGVLTVCAFLLLGASPLGSGSAESLVSFFAAILFLYRPIQTVGALGTQAASGLAGLERVDEILRLDTEPPSGAAPHAEAMRTCLEAENLGFAYGETPVLDGIDLRLDAGETVAVIGPNGCGKTTLLLILMGALPAQRGRVLVDGAPADHLALRRQFSWVPQAPTLFADTVLANVALGDAAPKLPQVRQALADADALPLVEALPQGLDTPLREGGANLSMGQRQRLCLARALYRRAPILLLDEPTANLDAAAAVALGETLVRLSASRTVLLVTHRQDVVRRADRIVVMEGGRIVRTGKPAELLADLEQADEMLRDDAAAAPVDGSDKGRAHTG